MPTVKQLKNKKLTLKTPNRTRYANKPAVPTYSTYSAILTDPATKREKQLVQIVINMQKRYNTLLRKKRSAK